MPLQLNLVERVLARLNIIPLPLIEVWIYWQATRTLQVAIRLGVFDALHKAPLSARQVARQVRASERGITTLLDALSTLGYVRKERDKYTNTDVASKWLVKTSPQSLVEALPAVEDAWQRWETLEETIRAGEPSVTTYEWFNCYPEMAHNFHLAMKVVSRRLFVDEVVSRVKLRPRARKLLDLGGSHGLYATEFCRKNPQLCATIFDKSEGIEVARETVQEEGTSDRISFQTGDFLEDEIGSDYDAILLFNVIHMYSPEINTSLLNKIFQALDSDGLVVILDQLASKPASQLAATLAHFMGLNLFAEVGGRVYTHEEVNRWLSEAGFVAQRRINLRRAPGASLVLGKKP